MIFIRQSLFLLYFCAIFNYSVIFYSSKIDLEKEFKNRCINGRVFAKEINYEIVAKPYKNAYYDSLSLERSLKNKTSIYENRFNIYITIKDGQLVEKTDFGFEKDDEYRLHRYIVGSDINWKNLPPINLDVVVTLQVILNVKGDIVKASIINSFTDDIEKVKLEEVWEEEIMRQIKLIATKWTKWLHYYRGGKIIHKVRLVQIAFKSH